MSDLELMLEWCRKRFIAQSRAGKFPTAKTKYCATLAFTRLAVGAQILLEKFDDGTMIWGLHPRPDEASQKSWVWLLAVRTGYSAKRLHEGAANDQNWRDALADDRGLECFVNAVYGPEIVDLVAFSLDFTKCFGALRHDAVVLGWPQHPSLIDAPVRVFRTSEAWIRSGCAGVVMVGDDEENLHWLRQCSCGIVTDNVAHGQALQKKLKRAYDGPQILVAA